MTLDYDTRKQLKSLRKALELFVDEKLSGSPFTDVTLSFSGVKFPAHRFILSVRSGYFRALFNNGFSDSKRDLVEFIDIDPALAKLFLRFIYTGKFEYKDTETTIAMYELGDRFMVPCLHLHCLQIINSSDQNDRLARNILSCQFKVPLFGYMLLLHFNCESLMDSLGSDENLPHCGKDFVLRLLNSMTDVREEFLLKFVLRWCDHHGVDDSFWPLVRFTQIPVRTLLSYLQPSPNGTPKACISPSPVFSQHVVEALRYAHDRTLCLGPIYTPLAISFEPRAFTAVFEILFNRTKFLKANYESKKISFLDDEWSVTFSVERDRFAGFFLYCNKPRYLSFRFVLMGVNESDNITQSAPSCRHHHFKNGETGWGTTSLVKGKTFLDSVDKYLWGDKHIKVKVIIFENEPLPPKSQPSQPSQPPQSVSSEPVATEADAKVSAL